MTDDNGSSLRNFFIPLNINVSDIYVNLAESWLMLPFVPLLCAWLAYSKRIQLYLECQPMWAGRAKTEVLCAKYLIVYISLASEKLDVMCVNIMQHLSAMK